MKFIPALAMILFFCNRAVAASYIPERLDVVLAKLPTNNGHIVASNTLEEQLRKLESLMEQAAFVGNYPLNREIEVSVDDLAAQYENIPRLQVLQAQVLQKNHKFSEAKIMLQKILSIDQFNANAHLMMARIYLIERDFTNAKKSCVNLIGNIDICIASVCSLEVESYTGDLHEIYAKLTILADQPAINDTRKDWLIQILATMAERLGRLEESEKWLDDNLNLRTSYFKQWCDIKLLLGKSDEVAKKSSELFDEHAKLDDGLIVMMAIAEKQMAAAGTKTSKKWRKIAYERVRLLELRLDEYHAGDIARYYLDVASNPEKARFWAEKNWEISKEYADEKLLLRAVGLSINEK